MHEKKSGCVVHHPLAGFGQRGESVDGNERGARLGFPELRQRIGGARGGTARVSE